MDGQLPEADLLRQRILGWGPACALIEPGGDIGRDVRLVAGTTGRDFARVRGMDNLGQTLAVALTTLLGSDIFNTRFGFDGLNALAEEFDRVLVRERIRIGIVKVLRNDPRIGRIVDVKLLDDRLAAGNPTDLLAQAESDALDSEPDSIPVGARTLSVRLVFETVTGDQATVDLGRIVPND